MVSAILNELCTMKDEAKKKRDAKAILIIDELWERCSAQYWFQEDSRRYMKLSAIPPADEVLKHVEGIRVVRYPDGDVGYELGYDTNGDNNLSYRRFDSAAEVLQRICESRNRAISNARSEARRHAKKAFERGIETLLTGFEDDEKRKKAVAIAMTVFRDYLEGGKEDDKECSFRE